MSSAAAILIVDDDSALRQLLSTILQRAGYISLQAASGQEALDICTRSAAVSLLITDVEMPGMRGPELIAELLKRRACPPVLYISGFCTEEGSRELVASGPVNFLRKPFVPEVLVAKVREVIQAALPSQPTKKPPGVAGSGTPACAEA